MIINIILNCSLTVTAFSEKKKWKSGRKTLKFKFMFNFETLTLYCYLLCQLSCLFWSAF